MNFWTHFAAENDKCLGESDMKLLLQTTLEFAYSDGYYRRKLFRFRLDHRGSSAETRAHL